MSDGYVFQHQLVLWNDGIDPRGFHVHHKNRDRHDNRPENLELLTEAQHLKEHNSPGTLRRNQFGMWPIAGEFKVCRECGQSRPIEHFSKVRGRPYSYCKPCMVIRVARYQKARRDRLGASTRATC